MEPARSGDHTGGGSLRRAPSLALRAVAAAAACGAVLALGSPAAASGGGEDQPTTEQMAAGLARAAALHAGVRRQAATVAQARQALVAAAADSALALESYSSAARLRDETALEQNRQEEALSRAAAAVADQQAGLGRWARQAYVDGGGLGSSPTVLTLLSGGRTDDIDTTRTWMERVGRSRSALVVDVQQALQQQQRATERAEQVAALAQAAAARADAARAARDAVLQAQRDQLASVESLLAGAMGAADQADAQAAAMAQAWTLHGSDSSGGVNAAGGPGGNRVTGAVGDCTGGQPELYPNGRIPPEALCPVLGTTGGLLRADAAYAFNRLSAEYARRFGQPICVTDTYRSYDEQVLVRARRGGFAATPGRSNHGWGTAADLCGGIEDFDSAAHAWLELNAPLFGWFHPAWADRGGSLPEPWHWEYGG